jgi:hypothetical protein
VRQDLGVITELAGLEVELRGRSPLELAFDEAKPITMATPVS